LNTYIRHTIIYFISKGIPGVLSFFAILYYSNKLDPSEYGLYSLIISAVGVLNIIGFDWFRFGVARFLPEYIAIGERADFISFIKTKVQITLIVTLVLTVLVYSIFPFFRYVGIDRWMIPVVSILTVLQYLFILFTRIVVTELKPRIFMWANFIKSFFGVLVSLLLVYLDYGFVGLLWGIGIGLTLSNVFLILKIKFPSLTIRSKIRGSLIKQIALYSLPMAASAGLSFILSYSNRFIINYYRGVEETGLFSLGYDFSQQTVGVFISIAATSAFPIAMKLFTENGNDAKLVKHMNNSLFFLCLIALPVVAIFGANSQDLSNLLLGDKFSSLNDYVIPIISFSAFILGIKGFYFDLYFYLIKETKYQLLILFGVACINLILNFIFVPHYGYLAAIWVGLLTSLIAVISTSIVTYKLLPIELEILPLVKVFLTAVLMFVVMKVFGNTDNLFSFSLKLCLGMFSYILIIALIERKKIIAAIGKKKIN
jgi:O-antigen/teichoic acid export membrane protein